ncbi:hypothetical protein [Thiomonas sp.]|uniref:hypothetical protein n=2 Tax=unclassified Thiomonas TaxID=2625466 RepID=UPI00258FF9AB|nr:hypothetical protein [Thiomonas sp.]
MHPIEIADGQCRLRGQRFVMNSSKNMHKNNLLECYFERFFELLRQSKNFKGALQSDAHVGASLRPCLPEKRLLSALSNTAPFAGVHRGFALR